MFGKKEYLCTRKFFIKFSLKLRLVGTIAQQVEQRTENPCVTGSIPVGATQKKSPRKGVFCFITANFYHFIFLPGQQLQLQRLH